VVGWIFDEAQDASKLLDMACRRLVTGEACRWAWLVGDPFQTVHSWAGARSEYFMSWPVEKQKIMPKSYRCGKGILEFGEACLRRMHNGYWDRGIAPADHDGRVTESDSIEDELADLDPSVDTLVIARTNWRVNRLAAMLDEAGIPFRRVKARGGAYKRDVGMTGLWKLQHDQIVDRDEWTAAIDLLPARTVDGRTWLVRGAKTKWAKEWSARFDKLFASDLEQLGATEHLRQAIASGKWAALCDGGQKWVTNVTRHGLDVTCKPRVRVGTIHCSPPDEPVLTVDGYVPIGDLDPTVHRLCSASDTGGLLVTWGGRGTRSRSTAGYGFVRACRRYSGDLVTISTDRSRTRVTPCHRVVVRWADSFFDKWLVYLMRSGDWWRVGVSTTASRPYKPGGIGGRLATEQGDGCWVLGIYETEREARFAEATIQAKYGIPGLCFRRCQGKADDSQRTEDLQRVHSECAPYISKRVREMLADFGLLEDSPLRRRDRSAVFGKVFETVAANVIPGYMEIPVVPEQFTFASPRTPPDWLAASVSREHYEGDVHSLEVLPHHYYVSGNAVVHNSVKGQEASKVVLLSSVGKRVREGEDAHEERHDEERRIEYVACTRAKHELVVAHDPREPYRMELF